MKYGFHGVYALDCLFEEAYRVELFHEYAGQILWNVNMIQGTQVENPNEMPQYIDLLYPVKQEKEESAEDIIKGILQKLG